MGYSTTVIDKNYALALTAGKDVIEASDLKFFDNKKWIRDIESAELGDNNRVYFKCKDNQFAVIEF